MKVHKASNLYSKATDDFICPACDKRLDFQPVEVKNTKVVVYCKLCKESFYISLPKIKKQLIYLDQWFVSNILYEDKKVYFESLITKIDELKKMQRVFVVVSDIHARETSAMATLEDQKIIQDKFNSLADYVVVNNNTLEYQYKRLLLKEDETFPWTDILDENPHGWTINTGNMCTITNAFAISSLISEKFGPDKDAHNRWVRDILDNQCNEINSGSTIYDCFEFKNDQWLLDINDAVDYYQASIKLMNFTDINELPSLMSTTAGGGFYQTLKSIINKCMSCRRDLSEEDILTLLRNTKDIPKKISLSSALGALGLYSAIQSINIGNEVTQNERRFSVKHGVSNQNDISHISTFAPYVDVLITDDTARDNLSHSIVKEQLANVKCKFYSNNNISDFEKYLDSLFDNAREENEVKMTRKLFWLLNTKEYQTQFYKKIDKKEIIEKVRKKLKKD